MFAYNFHRCVGNNHELAWPVGVFVVVVVVELELEVQLPMMELNGLLKEEKNYLYQNENKQRLFY